VYVCVCVCVRMRVCEWACVCVCVRECVYIVKKCAQWLFVTWFIHMCDVTYAHVRQNSYMCATQPMLKSHTLPFMCDTHTMGCMNPTLVWTFMCDTHTVVYVTHINSYVRHKSVTGLLYMRNTTHSYEWRDSFAHFNMIHVIHIWLTHMSGATHSHIWIWFTSHTYDSFIWVARLIHTYEYESRHTHITHSCGWHDSFTHINMKLFRICVSMRRIDLEFGVWRVTCDVLMCDVWRLKCDVWREWMIEVWRVKKMRAKTHVHMCIQYDSFTHGTTRLHISIHFDSFTHIHSLRLVYTYSFTSTRLHISIHSYPDVWRVTCDVW